VGRQREERGGAAHRLAVGGDELEPAHHREGDAVAEAQAEKVGRREVGGERGVAGVVEGEREIDAAAREGEAGETGIDARVLDRDGEDAVAPPVEGDVRQRRGDDRGAGRREVVLLGGPRPGFGLRLLA
jgi:hypothetical protein